MQMDWDMTEKQLIFKDAVPNRKGLLNNASQNCNISEQIYKMIRNGIKTFWLD